ncbi:hypothetical protein HNR12_005648 [Streptomonospora nanhaiensis]|uniref:Transposase n=1 Tax=Streptomonospora nanhaiensis TaxID=1323731 RepID=A0A853BW59_9ACTN|nr:hypothetical protein [Streptomonospora nanhaiensis]NYI99294.1 hypothetical protein [Streptomonospora nanhaiensis]
MDLLTRLSALAGVIGQIVLWLDAYTAACLDRRPLIRTAEDIAAWLGRTWRWSAAHARWRRHGPGRGLVAMTIRPPHPAHPARTQEDRHGI